MTVVPDGRSLRTPAFGVRIMRPHPAGFACIDPPLDRYSLHRGEAVRFILIADDLHIDDLLAIDDRHRPLNCGISFVLSFSR
jgi:hypothetical protein